MQSGRLDLNGVWELYTTDDFPKTLVAETFVGRHAFKATVPAPIHQVLMDAGVLDDPRVGLNSLRARWVEEQFWGYRRTFATPQGYTQETPAWLVFDKLELNAAVYLNGQEIGRHANAHRPARFAVPNGLRDGGENTLVVVLESGLYATADKPGAEYRNTPQAILTKIHWQRRGQWQRGWDWQQRLLNVGILGDVRLEWSDAPTVTQLQVYAMPSDDLTRATFQAKASLTNGGSESVERTLRLSLAEHTEVSAQVRITVPPGESNPTVSVTLENPRLWWPVGHGEPFQYTAQVTLEGGDSEEIHWERRVGVRKVEVDQSPHPIEGRHFILRINNRPIFCKGGNWVPADMLHSTVTPERYRELAELALGANFNLLRIWGGGVFADAALLDFCDENGLLIWHDLLFACSKYPGDYPEFAAEARAEVTWAMREMAHHASLVVWCGNNEIEEADWQWGWDNTYRTHPHYSLFHHDFPQIAAREDPSKFYWISSPYSPDYKMPRDPTVGDQHPWKVSLQMPGGADWWEYRKMVDRFPNEGGVLGCSTPATLRQFLPPSEQHLLSASWEHHDNPFAIYDMEPGKMGHAYETVRLWAGRDPLALDLDQYAFVSGLLQAEGLSEYIHNFRRRMFSSSAAIFWMYNDSWPVTHGWTIVDYYRRKKLAYHPFRRAFAPVTVVCHRDDGDDTIRFTVVNETSETLAGSLSYGTFEGMSVKTVPVTVPPNSAVACGDGIAGGEDIKGAFAALYNTDSTPIAQHRVFFARFGDLGLTRDPAIDLSLQDGILTLQSDVFVWGVCLDTDGESAVSDNCFDLLPGIPYTMPWDSESLGEPKILRTGNHDALV
ncbi:MAG: sugar-binding domain-containing protein [Armatimonadota bacterium]